MTAQDREAAPLGAPSALSVPTGATRRLLPYDVGSVTTARGLVTDHLRASPTLRHRHAASEAQGDPLVIDTANLVVGELVMNAVRHGQPLTGSRLEVTWWTDDDVLGFGVRDGGHAEHLRAGMPGPFEEGGRGLGIVERLSRSWSWDATDGTRVLVELPLA